MDLEAQLWILDPHIAAALDNFPFFWVLVVAFFSCQFVLDVFCVLGPDFGGSRSYFVLRTSLLSAGAGLSNQATLLSRVWVDLACLVLPTSRAQCRAVVWVIGPLNCGTGLPFFRVIIFFALQIPPLSEPGEI